MHITKLKRERQGRQITFKYDGTAIIEKDLALQ